MNARDLSQIIRTISEGVEHGAFTLNIFMRSGKVWKDVAATQPEPGNVWVELYRTDFPPVYVMLAEIEAIELCN